MFVENWNQNWENTQMEICCHFFSPQRYENKSIKAWTQKLKDSRFRRVALWFYAVWNKKQAELLFMKIVAW